MKKVKRTPDLRFPEFTNEQSWTKFGVVVSSNIYGPRFNANDYSETGNVKTIRGTDVGKNGELKYEQVPIAILDQKTVNNHKLLDGDLVMITTADCGLTGVFRTQEMDYISSAYGVRIRLNAKASPDYFKYFFQTRHAKSEIRSYERKATVSNLPGSDILKIKINLPQVEEQTKIAKFLTTVDKRINLLTQQKEKLEQYKKGVMQQIFSQQIRFKDDDGNDFPEWKKKRLGEVYEIVGGGTPETLKKEYWNGAIEWFTPTEIKSKFIEKSERKISESGLQKSSAKLLPQGTLLFTSRATIGDVGICMKKCCTNQGFQSFIPNEKNEIEFLYYWTLKNKKEFVRRSSGSTFLEISKKEMQKIKLLVPSLKEQQKIASFLSALDNKIELVNQQVEQTIIWKRGLLQKMFV